MVICDAPARIYRMREIRTRNGYIVLVDDHDEKRLAALLKRGGRIVGWIDGHYRVWMPKEGFDGSAKA